MKSRLGIRIILVLLAMAVAGFDRHISSYFPPDVQAMVQADAIPAHSDIPQNTSDHHEDFTVKFLSVIIHAPSTVSLLPPLVSHLIIPSQMPLAIWQPPKVSC